MSQEEIDKLKRLVMIRDLEIKELNLKITKYKEEAKLQWHHADMWKVRHDNLLKQLKEGVSL